MWEFVSALIAIVGFGVGTFFYLRGRRLERTTVQREADLNHRLFELAILKELGERIGYSLNVQNIADVITGSLHQFLDFSATSYMLLEPEKIVFKVHLAKSVSRTFVDDVRDRMLKSLSALLNREFKKNQVEEVVSGAILIEDVETPVRSFFNIPLIIGERVRGVITIAHTKPGLYKEDEMNILYKITRQASEAVTRLEEVVHTEELKLNAMVESMSEGVVMIDTSYTIVVVNPAARQAVGIPADRREVNIFDFIDRLGGVFDIHGKLEESIKLRKTFVVEEAFLNDRCFRIVVAPVQTTVGVRAGEILGGVTLFLDVTHEKEVERLRQDFTSMMVHELRSPLSGIKNIAELLGDPKKKKTAKVVQEYGSLVYESSSQMLELINDLLDVAKLEAGKFEMRPESVNITRVIDESIKLFTPAFEHAHLTASTVYDPRLPRVIELDAGRIGQALQNLLSNAIKFTKPGGTITVQALLHSRSADLDTEARKAGVRWWLDKSGRDFSATPDAIFVGVTDTGVGISEEEQAQLFNKFKQFRESAQKELRGTGLGLAITKGIVEVHGGICGVASREGKGSTFYFTVPLRGAGGAIEKQV